MIYVLDGMIIYFAIGALFGWYVVSDKNYKELVDALVEDNPYNSILYSKGFVFCFGMLFGTMFLVLKIIKSLFRGGR